ncbi:hypothetical protein [Sandaracinobacteroides hominis]|uniref:hypothetical protein n=1 Tax=Sandaracinobacteroides hominis TaxID=2780086 RepID=UPI0018F6A85E|nr:hypothetical protein [Sandaracinobacteroides hominis]
MAAAADALPQSRARARLASSLAVLFPALLNSWPLLLLVSQKAFVPIGLATLDYGSRPVQRDLMVTAVVLLACLLLMLLQPANPFALAHFAGFALFLLAVPAINHAVRQERPLLFTVIALTSLINASLAILFSVLEVDLSALRGLNRVINKFGVTDRVFYETTSLLAVFSLSFLRPKWLALIGYVIVGYYAIFLAKSVFVILLYAVNLLIPPIVMRSRLSLKFVLLGAAVAGLVAGVANIILFRPDIAMSLGVKFLQLQFILAEPTPLLLGGGWGHVIEAIVNDPDQPYQVEMQLPMLIVQAGLLLFLAITVAIGFLLASISTSRVAAALRILIFFVVGFNNPWLFIPSWYLTVALMFHRLEQR